MVEKYPEPQRVQSSATFKFWSGKAQKLQSRTQMTRIFKDPRASVQSVFHHLCSSLKNPASGASVSAFIRVYLRFFIDVIFQTGLTGSTGYVFDPVHPVILSNLKCPAPLMSAKLMEGVE